MSLASGLCTFAIYATTLLSEVCNFAICGDICVFEKICLLGSLVVPALEGHNIDEHGSVNVG